MCNLNSIEFVLIDLKFNPFRLIGETSSNGFCLRIKLCRTRIHHNKGFMKTSIFLLFFAESRNLQNLEAQGLLWKLEMEPLKRRSSVTVNTRAA